MSLKTVDRRGCCGCCPESDSEAGTSPDADRVDSPTELKPHYYFGVTVDDLRQADDDTPTFDNDLTYASVTTPPPDVVPHNGLDTTTHVVAPTSHEAQPSDGVYAELTAV